MLKRKKVSIILIVLMFVSAIAYTVIRNYNPLDDGSRERTIIQNLLTKGYCFILPNQYFSGVRFNKTAILIHDADFNLNGLSKFIQIETEYGVKSAFYPRPDTEWFCQNIQQLQKIQGDGWEIGFQYDCLSRSNGNYELAMQIFKGQLSYMRAVFNVTTTTYHGDKYNFNISNYNLYDEAVWHQLGLNEVYSLKGFSYFSDSNNKLTSPDALGDLVLIQLHTDWTG